MKELIDKKTTIKALMAEYRECFRDGEEMGGEAVLMAEGLDSAIDIVRNAPTIDPVKHGKWIFDLSDVDWTYGPYVCSECHVRNGDFIGGGLNKRTNYCPNCGAKMDNPQEENYAAVD